MSTLLKNWKFNRITYTPLLGVWPFLIKVKPTSIDDIVRNNLWHANVFNKSFRYHYLKFDIWSNGRFLFIASTKFNYYGLISYSAISTQKIKFSHNKLVMMLRSVCDSIIIKDVHVS